MTTTLSPREREVAKLVADGFRDQEIGLRLGISKRTVHAYLDSISRKIAVIDPTRSRRSIITRWLEQNAA